MVASISGQPMVLRVVCTFEALTRLRVEGVVEQSALLEPLMAGTAMEDELALARRLHAAKAKQSRGRADGRR
eukprot:12372473-Alexandrium_andersonii.AAC.1